MNINIACRYIYIYIYWFQNMTILIDRKLSTMEQLANERIHCVFPTSSNPQQYYQIIIIIVDRMHVLQNF